MKGNASSLILHVAYVVNFKLFSDMANQAGTSIPAGVKRLFVRIGSNAGSGNADNGYGTMSCYHCC